MTVTLLPPFTYSCGRTNATALATGPRFVRTRTMSRWHRTRSGVLYDGRRSFHTWCGQLVFDSEPRRNRGGFLGRDRDPVDGLPVCGTCEGRALGAGHDRNDGPRDLLFSPHPRRPRWCPGSNRPLYAGHEDPRGWPRVGTCLVCGAVERVRASSHSYGGHTVGLTRHEPLALIDPCPFHGWRHLTARGGVAVCAPCTSAQEIA